MATEIDSRSMMDGLMDFFVKNEGKITAECYFYESLNIKHNRTLNFLSSDPRTKQWFLSYSFTPLFTILVTYLYFCLYAGKRWMKNRKPFQLKNTLVIYNAVQIVLSLILVVEVSI